MLLLPLPAAAVATTVVPLVHLGMPVPDGLRIMLGTYVAAAFTAVITELLRRGQRAPAELADAHERLRHQAEQAEELHAPGLGLIRAGHPGTMTPVMTSGTWPGHRSPPAMALVMLLRPAECAH